MKSFSQMCFGIKEIDDISAMICVSGSADCDFWLRWGSFMVNNVTVFMSQWNSDSNAVKNNEEVWFSIVGLPLQYWNENIGERIGCEMGKLIYSRSHVKKSMCFVSKFYVVKIFLEARFGRICPSLHQLCLPFGKFLPVGLSPLCRRRRRRWSQLRVNCTMSKALTNLLIRDTRLVYKHLATLYFVFVFDSSENELAMLDLIQVFVETLDRCFKNVCELDVVFNFSKMHTILDEMILGGQVLETSSEEVMKAVEEIARLEKSSNSSSFMPKSMSGRFGR